MKNALRVFWLVSMIFLLKIGYAQENVANGYKNNIKCTLLSIGSGSSRVTYERAIVKNMSAEITLGWIGLGYDFLHDIKSKGYLVKLAYKWNLIPMKSSNSPLAGFYVKPELQFVSFDYAPKKTGFILENTKHTTHAAVLGEVGYQVLVKRFVFDVYAGIGSAFGTDNDENYFHGFVLMPKGSWLAGTAGFRLGVAF